MPNTRWHLRIQFTLLQLIGWISLCSIFFVMLTHSGSEFANESEVVRFLRETQMLSSVAYTDVSTPLAWLSPDDAPRQRVTAISLSGPGEDPRSMLAKLTELSELRRLQIGYRITDVDLEYLSTLPRLESLHLDNAAISHSGIESISRNLKELRTLRIQCRDPVGDTPLRSFVDGNKAMQALASLKYLEDVDLTGARLSSSEIQVFVGQSSARTITCRQECVNAETVRSCQKAGKTLVIAN